MASIEGVPVLHGAPVDAALQVIRSVIVRVSIAVAVVSLKETAG
jgi:hypothetical protein